MLSKCGFQNRLTLSTLPVYEISQGRMFVVTSFALDLSDCCIESMVLLKIGDG